MPTPYEHIACCLDPSPGSDRALDTALITAPQSRDKAGEHRAIMKAAIARDTRRPRLSASLSRSATNSEALASDRSIRSEI